MSFLRHGEIYPCDEGTISRPCPHSSPWMSLQLVIPGRLLCSRARFRFTSRSYTANYQPRPTMLRQRTAKCRLTGCLSRGVQSTVCLRPEFVQQGCTNIELPLGSERGLSGNEDRQHFDCATWLHKARELPKEQFKREVEKELTLRETEEWEITYFK